MDAAVELRSVQTISTQFHGFDESEVQRLAASMTVAEFKENETVVQKGERASWFGLVLRGTVRAVITAEVSFNIYRGEFLGEQSIFERSANGNTPIRSATVVGATDGILGLFTFKELEAFINDEPALGLKLVDVLGSSSVAKLNAERARAVQEARRKPQYDQLESPMSQLQQLKTVASESPALEVLSEDDLESLFPFAKIVPFGKGEEIMHRGEECLHAAIVLSGEVVGDVVSGDERRRLGPGDCMCERRLFEPGSVVSTEVIVGATNGTLLTVTRDALLSSSSGFAKLNPSSAFKVLKAFANSSLRTLRQDVKELREGPSGSSSIPDQALQPASGASLDSPTAAKEHVPKSRRRASIAVGRRNESVDGKAKGMEDNERLGFKTAGLTAAAATSRGRRASVPVGGDKEDASARPRRKSSAGSGGEREEEVFLRKRLNNQEIKQREQQIKAASQVKDIAAEKLAVAAKAEKLSRELENMKILLQKEQRLTLTLKDSQMDLTAQLEEEKGKRAGLMRKHRAVAQAMLAERAEWKHERQSADEQIDVLLDELDQAKQETAQAKSALAAQAAAELEANSEAPPPAQPEGSREGDDTSVLPVRRTRRRSRDSWERRASSLADSMSNQIVELQERVNLSQSSEHRRALELTLLQEELSMCEREPAALDQKLRQANAMELTLMGRVSELRAERERTTLSWDAERDGLHQALRAAEADRADLRGKNESLHDAVSDLRKQLENALSDNRCVQSERNGLQQRFDSTLNELRVCEESNAALLKHRNGLEADLSTERATVSELRWQAQRILIAGRALACVYLRQVRLLRRKLSVIDAEREEQRSRRLTAEVALDKLQQDFVGMEERFASEITRLTAAMEQTHAHFVAESDRALQLNHALETEQWCYQVLARLLMLCQARLRSYEAAFGSFVQGPRAHPAGTSILIDLSPTDYSSSEAPTRIKALSQAMIQLEAIERRAQPSPPSRLATSSRGTTLPYTLRNIPARHNTPCTPLLRPVIKPAGTGIPLEEAADMTPRTHEPGACPYLFAGKSLLPKVEKRAALPWSEAFTLLESLPESSAVSPTAHQPALAEPSPPRSGFTPFPPFARSPRSGVLSPRQIA